MSLQSWHDNGWLRPHSPTREEIANLFAIVERDLKDAGVPGVSSDWRFGIAYNAALKLCTILLHAEGFRPEHSLNHYRTIAALPLILGDDRKADADYLETCRRKRNVVEYDRVGDASDADAGELTQFVAELIVRVRVWLKAHHPSLT
ncbi:MAG: hypothetical protein JXR37_37455 [Kiritimatiellae bacterium]|nr:hypothetical protein [Kiritimatiellia bacterium]